MNDRLIWRGCRIGKWIVVRAILVTALALGGSVMPSRALINPTLQPRDLYERYDAVIACRVKMVNTGDRALHLGVEEVISGSFKRGNVSIEATEEAGLAPVLSVAEGQRIVAFAGQSRRRRHQGGVLYYVGGGSWFDAEFEDGSEKGRWRLLGNADRGTARDSDQIMYGTFNGRVENLERMMRDLTRGQGYFPDKPFTRFGKRQLDELSGSIRAVAMHDINRDGRLDALACSDLETVVYLQQSTGEWVDRTDDLNLASAGGAPSCSLADVDLDGDSDLLLGRRLFLQTEGRFELSEQLGSQKSGSLVSAGFVELNADGSPDVVASREGGGLAVRLSSDGEGFDLTQATAGLGIDSIEGLRNATGDFEYCDWNLDGAGDLIYMGGRGYLLVQNEEHAFDPFPLRRQGATFMQGTAAFGALVMAGDAGAVVGDADGKMLLQRSDEAWIDVSGAANEFKEEAIGLRNVIVADLNADGTVDVFGTTRQQGAPSYFAMNRGYGSFMYSMKYAAEPIFPQEVTNKPANAAMAGDATGDGARDILIGGADGRLTLLVNETLQMRPESADIATPVFERKRIQARILTVVPEQTRGVVGSRLRLVEEGGETTALRFIGSNLGVGCGSPHQINLAIRNPGRYTLEMRFADGASSSVPVAVQKNDPRHRTVRIKRP